MAVSCSEPPPNPLAAGSDGRRVLSRVGVADHALTPEAPWTGSGWRGYSYGGFGEGTRPSTGITTAISPISSGLTRVSRRRGRPERHRRVVAVHDSRPG